MDRSDIIAKSPAMEDLIQVLARAAPTDSTVLITGEPGTGKKLFAGVLHKNSLRASHPFVPVRCSAVSGNLLDIELFGHEKADPTGPPGFSGWGRLEQSEKGIIFLDEIDKIDPGCQIKILRFIQDREFERAGGIEPRKADVRVIASSTRDLEQEVKKGSFREDLYYRLNVIPLALPPLRVRGGDIILLAEFFLKKFCLRKGGKSLKISPMAKDILMSYTWPGNVLELENLMERMSVLGGGREIMPEDLPDSVLPSGNSERAQNPRIPAGFKWPVLRDMAQMKLNLKEFLEEIEKNLLAEALSRAGGVKNQAAEVLGMKRTTLIEKLKKKNPLKNNTQI